MSVIDEIEFMDPKPTQGARIDYGAVKEVLKSKPGEWARVRRYKSTIGLASWRKGLGAEFEVIGRAADDGPGTWVFARFVGEAEQAGDADVATIPSELAARPRISPKL